MVYAIKSKWERIQGKNYIKKRIFTRKLKKNMCICSQMQLIIQSLNERGRISKTVKSSYQSGLDIYTLVLLALLIWPFCTVYCA